MGSLWMLLFFASVVKYSSSIGHAIQVIQCTCSWISGISGKMDIKDACSSSSRWLSFPGIHLGREILFCYLLSHGLYIAQAVQYLRKWFLLLLRLPSAKRIAWRLWTYWLSILSNVKKVVEENTVTGVSMAQHCTACGTWSCHCVVTGICVKHYDWQKSLKDYF